ncbi:ERMES complex subunit [Didymosphaeria variabile]|uniref:Mitochondrial distribution and morphology protein 34 n=1 Tax=Didymosphaeria variabile TaxID=1932322 RepID=A0A9W8XQV6_9PLEO|nr:ERMES complex subunit [Didymosphaeria variabile]KAJ4356662.1 ERMES complex subunit [Didymosphaeria variabile]
MAFNFNWSPLIADTSRARDMLTTALNKGPKPPIIVDDITVTELNLGSTPPELEILEIGDLAEDRFRGIFKMTYTGDAFLTLKTKVQANPLNTYLSTKPDFASPEPLAASAGLTIPLQITLSDIRLSGFVILVFSKQKGITLVFRNDPLESLKVSSTFDSIPFIKNYLQKEIEGQLRVLFMEDLPAIIHRLSLRLWSPEFQELDAETEERLDSSKSTIAPIDPLSSPPQDAVDEFGNPIDASQMATLALDSASEIHASFSQKNMLRLAALSQSQQTLSLFTPNIREAVFRAWASNPERPDSGTSTPALTQSSLSRIQSTFASVKSNASSVASGSTGQDTNASRPTMSSNYSSAAGLSLGANRSRGHQMRKRKKRVVDLRKNRDGAESSGLSTEANTPLPSTTVSETASVIPEEREREEVPIASTPPRTPSKATHGSLDAGEPSRLRETETSAPTDGLLPPAPLLSLPPKSKAKQMASTPVHHLVETEQQEKRSSRPPLSHNRLRSTQQASSPLLRSLSFDKVSSLSAAHNKGPLSPPYSESTTSSSGGILEQAWMLKMAQEIAKKVREEKDRSRSPSPPQGGRSSKRSQGLWEAEEMMEAPPAYVA